MKLIIDIPEKLYVTCINIGIKTDEQIAIANGTPLPKGHGRLIDADALVKKGGITKDYLNIFAPTIIEADKIESEEK